MPTEDVAEKYRGLDTWSGPKILNAILDEQLAAVAAVRPALSAIAAAADVAAINLRNGGRLIYVGAGTSARIGVQDGVELTPTFNWPPDRILYLIAGGEGALVRSIEHAEDDENAGRQAISAVNVGTHDIVIGVAASGTTPFTVAAVRAARQVGALSIGIANNLGAPLLEVSEHPIFIATGSEVVAGSTRMKAGTAQKVVLNLFSTLVMIRLGRVYDGQMVHMRVNSAKLHNRAVTMVSRIAGVDLRAARLALDSAGQDVKTAILIARGSDRQTAEHVLTAQDGNLRLALKALFDASLTDRQLDNN
jgi:N-acetylmuramic acid 6-phosphate etherase